MKRILIFIYSIAVVMASHAQTSTTVGCSISRSGAACLNKAVTFYSDCQEGYNTYRWFLNDNMAGENSSFTYTFTASGSYKVRMNAWCSDLMNCPGPKSISKEITVLVSPDIKPGIIANTTALCETGNVTFSVDDDVSAASYRWRSVPAGFNATGSSVTFNNVSATTTFYVSADRETCSSESQITVTVGKTVLVPSLTTNVSYHKRVLTASGSRVDHYWQTSGDGMDVRNPVKGDYTIYEPGNYYIRQYLPAGNCWATATGPLHVDIDYTPPLASVVQVQKAGYSEIFMTNEEKDHILSYADYYWVNTPGDNPSIVKVYSKDGSIPGSKVYISGTYYLKGRDRATGTWGPTLTMTISLRSDESLNWVHTRTYDGTMTMVNSQSVEQVTGESKSYFDNAGRTLQSQTRNLTSGKILATQQLRDRYNRVVGSTLPAPVAGNDFLYNAAFLQNSSGDIYGPKDFDWINPDDQTENTVYNPAATGKSVEGTVGWYYSDQNTIEPNTPHTQFPYTRTEFYDDGTGEVKREADAGDMLRLGTGNEIWNGTFPVFNELDDYLKKRDIVLSGISGITTFENQAVQQVSRDRNKRFAVVLTDKEGKSIMTGRFGSPKGYALEVTNTVGCGTNQKNRNFYITNEQKVKLYCDRVAVKGLITNIVTGEKYPFQLEPEPGSITGPQLPVGFYRVEIIGGGDLALKCTNYLQDVSYQFYDDAGRLVSSVSPNGVQEWLKNKNTETVAESKAKYAEIDKTTYQYNFKGWLLSVKEPDAGETNYQYRKDGRIRFSQNAQQKNDKHFSYTRYDAVSRPVESGEYIGDKQAYALSGSQLEFDKQVQYIADETRDWVITHYDYPDENFNSFTGLDAIYNQEFTLGAVSWSENANMKTWYSYDELGRVTWMAQKPAGLERVFVVKYTYNFIGNVLKVENLSYSLGGVLLEQFYHYYEYDADNRLSKVYTSATTEADKKLRATYTYYLHGPLKRIELGDKLQGIDFVYNIHGWLTQINHPDKTKDPGKDGDDVFGMILNYYETDLANVFGKNEKMQAPDPDKFHHLPQMHMDDGSLALAFDSRMDYQKSMRENLKQLQAMRQPDEAQVLNSNDPLLEPAIPILYPELSAGPPDFNVLDTFAVASAKPVLYSSLETNVVPDDIEFAALKDIFTNLGGTGWLKKTNWPATWPATATSAEFSKWFGVVVANGDVISLNLPSNKLTGTIPASIANLSQLTSIYMQGNSIAGSIPTEIGSLSKLTLLYLYVNNLTGTIPASLGNLKNLVYLYLNRNGLTGTIPSELSGMNALQFLHLEENNLSGTLPAWLASLKNLVHINVYDNAFTGTIPAEWNALTNLTLLNLSYNKLTGDIPVLDKLYQLVTLDLRVNGFTGEIPLWLSGLTELENIYLGANKLTGTIPASLGTLRKLKALTLNTNQLQGSLPPSLGELGELVSLYVNQNQLSGELPPAYGLLSKLQTFNATENKLTGNIPASYGNLKELRYFNVMNNQLSGEIPDIFNGWTKATSFYIALNKFSGAVPVSVGSMINLTYCYLSNNSFTSVPASLLNLKKAVYIMMEGNKLHDIPDFTVLPQKAVLYLYVRNNYLDAADLEPLYTGVNTSGFKTLMATPQLADPAMRISVPEGESLNIPATGRAANTTFIWEKQSGKTWTDVTAKNQSQESDKFIIANPVAADAGIYRYRVTNAKITALTITSNPITVQTVDALPVEMPSENGLYNGLITSVQWRTDEANSAGAGDYYGQYKYAYDDKYQLLEANYADFNKTTRMFESAGNNYRLMGMSYDPNGNILSLKRYDEDGLYKNNLAYKYLPNTNKLDNVDTYVDKFAYNAIGQMTDEDKTDNTYQSVEYDVTGKVRKVYMDANKSIPNVEYLYDDRGFRLAKIAYQEKRTTWYIRDASGNILSIYEQAGVLADPVRPIQWASLTNIVNTNGTLTVQSGATKGTGWADRLAENQDGYIEYTIVDKFQPKDIGFYVPGLGSCMFNFYPSPQAMITVRKNGAFQSGFGYTIGDKIKLEKKGDKLYFWQNNAIRFEIAGVAAKTAQIQVNLNAATSSISNLVFKAYATEKQLPSLTQVEVPIYGSGKLGTYYPAQDGSTAYEITDHLGNVRALVRENVNIYTATMEDNGTADLTNPRVAEMNYFQNIFETEVKDVQMNRTQSMPGRVDAPEKAAYLYWVSGTQGMDKQDKSVGPAIALKVNAGDKVNLETWARYEHKEDFTEDVSLMVFSQLLGSTFAYIQGFDAMPVSKATETFQAALPALTGAGVDASQPRAFLNYIVFNSKMESIASDRVQVSEAAGFEPDERAVKNMHEKLAMNVSITEPGYIYAWVSNGSENTKVWFDDFSVSHTSNFVTQATDYGAWGDVLREQKTDESEYRYSYQGQYAEKDEETGWNHFELREYDPIIGRWITTDPIHQFYSPYIGMGNDPVSGNDPNGGEANWVPGVDKEGNAIMTKQDGDTYESLVKNYGEDLAKLYDKNAINNLKVGESFQLNKGLTGQIFKDWSQTNIVDFFMNNYNCFELATKYTKGQKPGVSMEEGTFERELDQNFRQTSEMINRKTIVAMKDDRGYTHAALFYGKSKDGTWYFLSKNGKDDPGFYTLRLLGKIYNPVKQEFWIRK